MEIDYYHIDSFASKVFTGNPAGVCFLERWPDDSILQSIARENNLAETAFVLPAAGSFDLRWFSPEMEIDLCGHATLAAAHALFGERGYEEAHVLFRTLSGELKVQQKGDRLEMDFPARPPEPCEPPKGIEEILACPVIETMRSRDLMVVVGSQEEVRLLSPDIAALSALPDFGVIVTAPGKDCDFVSRFFAPRAGIPEDPVTGSAHSTLIPYWSKRLGKREMRALQLSLRGGELYCEDRGDRVGIAGRAVTYLTGTLTV